MWKMYASAALIVMLILGGTITRMGIRHRAEIKTLTTELTQARVAAIDLQRRFSNAMMAKKAGDDLARKMIDVYKEIPPTDGWTNIGLPDAVVDSLRKSAATK